MTDVAPGERRPRSVPHVLFITTELWISTARLSMTFASFGCRISLLGPPNHPALLTGAIGTHCRHDPFRPASATRRTLLQLRPDAVIPADEKCVLHLCDLWDQCEGEGSEESFWLLSVLKRSLGSREALSASRSRMHVLRIAQEEGVLIPATICIDAEDELGAAAAKLGLPLVLKADMTSGGDGVHIVSDIAEAQRSWRKLHHPPNLARALRRGVLYKNWTHLRSWARRETLGITAQRFVAGSERTSMAVCVAGEVTASVCLEVARTWQVRGPSSVLRLVEDDGMNAAMSRIAKRLCLSGFCGFDFMVPQGAGESLLIEMNPRPTQTSHLALGAGRDLVAAYVRGVLEHKEASDRPAVTGGSLIALFPQELVRDSESAAVREAYHDVPWDSPRLMKRALHPLPSVVTDDVRWQGER